MPCFVVTSYTWITLQVISPKANPLARYTTVIPVGLSIGVIIRCSDGGGQRALEAYTVVHPSCNTLHADESSASTNPAPGSHLQPYGCGRGWKLLQLCSWGGAAGMVIRNPSTPELFHPWGSFSITNPWLWWTNDLDPDRMVTARMNCIVKLYLFYWSHGAARTGAGHQPERLFLAATTLRLCVSNILKN